MDLALVKNDLPDLGAPDLGIPDLGTYDFIDFGCSNGGSLQWASKKFPQTRGIGIDIHPAKVEAARAAGHHALLMNALDLKAAPRIVDFCVIAHFLEHLSGYGDAKAILSAACTAARKFVIVRQPWFDADGWLFARGLKFYWSDWTGHPYHMDCLQLQTALRDIKSAGLISRFAIYGNVPIKSSKAGQIHSLASPIDQHDHDDAKHPPKIEIDFPEGIFKEVFALAVIDGDLDALSKTLGLTTKIFDSEGMTPTANVPVG